jgi:hydroxymethylglutaryl-CoA lyase
MADAEQVCARLPQRAGVVYSGLVLNPRGLTRACVAGLRHVDIGVSASETHSRKNANVAVDEALANVTAMVAQTRAACMTVRGGIQCAFGCAYEGVIDPDRVLAIARRLLALGVDELALADSTGMANPHQVAQLMSALRPLAGATPIILHLHDTRGLGLANVLTALECGIYRFDTAFGGLGGCPFIKGATGNIATEDTLYLLESMGIATDVERRAVAACSHEMAVLLGRDLPGKLYKLSTER